MLEFAFAAVRNRLFWLLAIITLLYTLLVLEWSFRQGRLSMDPVWDDVVYLVEGQERLSTLNRGGFWKLIYNLWHEPPHSPWSTTLALLGFLIFGLDVWAPYAMNFVLVFAFLLIADSFISDQSIRNRLLILSVILVLPLTLRAVHDFRPDIALGLSTAFFCLSALRIAIFPRSDGNRTVQYVLLGVLGGITLLIKPSFLLHSIALLSLSVCLAEVLSLFAKSSDDPLSTRLKRWALFFLSLLAVCGPYYLRGLRAILAYITQSTGSGRYANIWKVAGGWRGALDTALRWDTRWMVGPSIYLFDAAIVLGVAWFIVRKKWRELAFVCGGLACAGSSLAIVIYSQINNPFFGLTWQIILVLLALYCIGKISTGFRFAPPFFFAGAVVMLFLNPPGNIGWSRVEDMVNCASMNRVMIDRIKAAVPNPGHSKQQPVIVYVGFIGGINSGSQDWIAHVERLNLIFPGLDMVGGLQDQYDAAQKADVVELAAPDSSWLNKSMPTSGLQEQLLEKMRKDDNFAELAPVIGKEGKAYVFIKRALLQKGKALTEIHQ